jgi:hypothetical protein
VSAPVAPCRRIAPRRPPAGPRPGGPCRPPRLCSCLSRPGATAGLGPCPGPRHAGAILWPRPPTRPETWRSGQPHPRFPGGSHAGRSIRTTATPGGRRRAAAAGPGRWPAAPGQPRPARSPPTRADSSDASLAPRLPGQFAPAVNLHPAGCAEMRGRITAPPKAGGARIGQAGPPAGEKSRPRGCQAAGRARSAALPPLPQWPPGAARATAFPTTEDYGESYGAHGDCPQILASVQPCLQTSPFFVRYYWRSTLRLFGVFSHPFPKLDVAGSNPVARSDLRQLDVSVALPVAQPNPTSGPGCATGSPASPLLRLLPLMAFGSRRRLVRLEGVPRPRLGEGGATPVIGEPGVCLAGPHRVTRTCRGPCT